MPVLSRDEENFTRLKHTLLKGGFEEVWELDHVWIFNIHLGMEVIIIIIIMHMYSFMPPTQTRLHQEMNRFRV